MIQFIHKKQISLNFHNKFLAIIVAALLGMVSPLPTYAAVPIALAFLPLGVPIGAIISFVIASPLINPGVFFLTLTQLGIEIALARTIATFFIAVSGGLLAGYFLGGILEFNFPIHDPHRQVSLWMVEPPILV